MFDTFINSLERYRLERSEVCFRIVGSQKFFVEAKKPSVYIKGDVQPAFQLRRYAWSAKLPLSILTDFEEFAYPTQTLFMEKGEGSEEE